MYRKTKVILGLLAVGLTAFCVITFWALPAMEQRQAEYDRNQRDALTHDITAIEKYRSAYVGDAPNLGGLLEHLPLGDIGKQYTIDSDLCTVTVDYRDTVWNIGEEKVQRDLLYNAAAVMASIDNLAGITYRFPDGSFTFDRKTMEDAFGSPLSHLLAPAKWRDAVQTRLSSEEFCRQFYQ